jgi:hypothetical protein
MSSYRCPYCQLIRYDRGQRYVQAFCTGIKECRKNHEAGMVYSLSTGWVIKEEEE